MNLFENILSKAKSGVDYLASGQLGSDIFDATYKGGDPTQTIPYKAVNTAARGISNVTGQGMEDKTQSLAYKTIQGGANLYTGVKNRIQETAQDDKNAFDAQISQKRQQFISDMLAKGKKKEDIFSALNSLKGKGEFDYKPGITGSIVSGLGNRMQSLQDTTENLSKIENPIERTLAGVIPYAGQTVATPLQPIASALEPFISPVVQKVIEKTGQSENIQELSKGWAEFEKTNPILAENIAGLLNVGQIAPVPFVKPVTSAVGKGVIATGKAISKGAESVAPKVVEFGRQTGKQISKIGDDVKNMYSESVSGLNKSEQAGMQSNPYQQKDFAEMVQRTKSPEGIDDIKNYQTEQYGKVTEQVTKTLDDMQKNFSEDGKVYQEIKGLPTRVQSQPILSSIESHPLLAMDETGRIVRKTGIESGTITDSDISHINRLYQDIRASVESGNGTLSVEQLLKSRSTASKYARYDKMDVNTLSADGARIMRDIRGSLDRVAKEQVPGLKELDSLYVDKMTELNDALRDLIYKGGDVKGEYRSNLGSIISNLANPSRANLLARLEQVIPGIGQKVESIRNLATLHKTMNDKGIFARYSGAGGAVVGATTLGTAFPVVGHIVGFLGGGLLGRLIEGGVTKGKVRILEKILSKETPARQAEISKIAKAVEEGKKLDAQGKKIIEEIKAKIIYEKARATVQPDDSKLLLPAPTGKATGARNVRVNQPMEKAGIKPDITSKSKIVRPTTKPKEGVVVPKAPIVKKETIVKPKEVNGNIRAIGQSKDFIEYFRKDLGDNVTIDGLKKFGFTESQIKDNSYNFLKSKDNPLGVSLEDLFYIAKGNTKGQTPAGPTTINTMGKRVIKEAPNLYSYVLQK